MKLTQRTVDGLAQRKKEYVAWDDALPGFGVRVKPTGHTAYVIQYRKGNRSRRYTIGGCSVFRLDQARRKAQQLLVGARSDGDPASDKAGALRAETVADLAQRYMQVHAHQKKRPSSARSDESNLRLHVLPDLGTLSVREIARADVSHLHHKMRKTPGAANRTLALLSKMFNLAEKWDIRAQGSNPCRHVDRYPERNIERYLSDAEMARLANVLAEAEELGTEHPSVVRAIRLLVFTGARLSEILNLRWDQVDFDRKLIIIPEGKTGRRIIYLNPPTVEVLASRPRDARSEWVLPGAKAGHPLVNLRKPWYRLRAKAGLHDVRIHDLRHNFASAAAGGGLSLPVIGELLGHTQPATTARYAHLAADPLRQASDRVASRLSAAMIAKPERDVTHETEDRPNPTKEQNDRKPEENDRKTSTRGRGLVSPEKVELVCNGAEVPFNETLLDNVYGIAADYVIETNETGGLVHWPALRKALRGLEGFPWNDVRLIWPLKKAYIEAKEYTRPMQDVIAAERLFRVIRECHLDQGRSGRRPEVARNEMFWRLGQAYVGQFNDPAEREVRRITRGGKRDKHRGHMFIKGVAKLIYPGLTEIDYMNGIIAAAKKQI